MTVYGKTFAYLKDFLLDPGANLRVAEVVQHVAHPVRQVAGFLLAETAERTRRFFAGLGIIARETAEKMLASLGSMFGGGAGETSRFRSL